MGDSLKGFPVGRWGSGEFAKKILDMCPIMRLRKKVPTWGNSKRIGDEPMKRALRTSILMLGLVGTFFAATVQQVPAPDGGPILLCPPHQPHCDSGLPPQ
jgi:hypothetical protein